MPLRHRNAAAITESHAGALRLQCLGLIGSASAVGHKSEWLEELVAGPQNSHRDTMDRRADCLRSIARRIAACVSPGALSNRALC